MTARRSAPVVGLLAAVTLMLSACAAEPLPDWEPPQWEGSADVHLITGLAPVIPENPETVEEEPDPAEDEESSDPGAGADDPAAEPEASDDDAGDGDAGDDGSAKDPNEAIAERKRELQQLGVLEQRLRDDALPIQARWVYLPGEHPFNDRMDDMLWEAIDAEGGGHEPQVFPTGMQDRGCLPGSLVWPAEEVLRNPATGPAGGEGTAITCEIAGAFGAYIGVTLRTVTGGPDEITDDHRTTVYANIGTGELIESEALWNSDAAPELWTYAVDLLRREAGALSTAPLAPPSDAQVALVAGALDAAQVQEGGGVLVTLPPGLASPELAGLGIPATVEPVQVFVEAEIATGWANLTDDLLAEAAGEPFTGLPTWTANTHVDCDLVPCIAITYDDGPSEFTPRLLDTLYEHRAPATFYMLGRSMRGNPDTVGLVASAGHEIASHTMQHPDLTELEPDEMEPEVMDAAELIESVTGQAVTSFRPPYGAVNKEVLEEVDLPAILWTVDTLDWERPGLELLLERAVEGSDPGDIVLFHDIHEPSVDAAGPVFEGLRDRGFVPVTVTQLFDGSLPEGKVTGR